MNKALLLFDFWSETKKGKNLKVVQWMPGM